MPAALQTALLFLLILGTSGFSATYDLIIRNGRIIDGSGNPSFRSDVAVKNGKIAWIGKTEQKAVQEIDANGMVVAPGFIDVHTHAEDILQRPEAQNFARMGVTTVVMGNCGSSALRVGEFFRNVEATNVSINVASLIGHGTVRETAMHGNFDRAPTSEEMMQMKELVEQGMRDGAVGLSTGLIYLPGTFATTEEIIELAKVASKYDGLYASHMRDEGKEIFKSLNEVFRIAREAHIRAEVSHIKLSGKLNWGRAERVLAAIDKARADGLDITQDQYVYTASSTGIAQLIPEEYREGGKFRERLAQERSKIVEAMKEKLHKAGRKNYSYAVIADYKYDGTLNGLNIMEAARKTHGSSSLGSQVDLILDIQNHGGASGVFHGMSEDDLKVFLTHPNTMIASDSGVRAFEEGVPHPRGYGNNARVLEHYVSELKLLRLEDAIRRMTSLPASTFRLKGRGELREGNAADLVIFDPAKVHEETSFKEPHHYASGFEWVLVNGVPVVQKDKYTGKKPGQVVRREAGNSLD
ncbi:MAG: D-aminoacylase domain protein [Verrucomicrobiales bacterium]|nr:D-aminoacylase domain protein [Verrucomicrobiales bacterium]